MIKRFIVLLILFTSYVRAAQMLLPGVKYAGGDNLDGRLIFLLSDDASSMTNTVFKASLYEFDLKTRMLRKMVDAPYGYLIPEMKEGVFGIVYKQQTWVSYSDTNIFFYSEKTKNSRIVQLAGPHKRTSIVSGHAFIQIERLNGEDLYDCELTSGKLEKIELLDASVWKYGHYNKIHVPRKEKNILHFNYDGYGAKKNQRTDYKNGCYSFNVLSREIKWVSESKNDKDDETDSYIDAKGNYLYFGGENGPVLGFTLFSSPVHPLDPRRNAQSAAKEKIIKQFSRWGISLRASYAIRQMSPDRRHIVICFQEPSSPKTMGQSGWKNTYIMVDVETGEESVLLVDEVDHASKGMLSGVRWIE